MRCYITFSSGLITILYSIFKVIMLQFLTKTMIFFIYNTIFNINNWKKKLKTVKPVNNSYLLFDIVKELLIL